MKPRPLFRVSLPVFVILTLGAVQSGNHSFTVFDENGVTVSETIGGPRYQGELFSLRPVATVNQNQDNPESLLYRIGDASLDEDLNIYIVDARTWRIVVYNKKGEYSHSIGRRGNGPGEFQSIEIVQLEGDVLTLWDDSSLRMTRYRCDGTFLDSRQSPNVMRVTSMLVLPDERLLTWKTSSIARDGYTWSSVLVSILSSDGDVQASIESGEVVRGTGEYRSSPLGGREMITVSIPFTGNPKALYDPDRGIMVTTGMESDLRWYDLTGALAKVYRLPMEVHRITNRIKQDWLDELRETMREYIERSGQEPPSLREQVFPEHVPLWRGGFIDDAGYLWLYSVHLPGVDEISDGRTCHVIDSEGRYLGTSTLPGLVPIVRYGHMISTIRDAESGENIITLYRIQPRPRGMAYPESGG